MTIRHRHELIKKKGRDKEERLEVATIHLILGGNFPFETVPQRVSDFYQEGCIRWHCFSSHSDH